MIDFVVVLTNLLLGQLKGLVFIIDDVKRMDGL